MAQDRDRLAQEIYLLYTGGRPSVDTNVYIPQIALLVDKAIGKYAVQDYWNNWKMDQQRSMNGVFQMNFRLAVGEDKDFPKLKSAPLPQKYLQLPKGRGIEQIAYGDYGTSTLTYIPFEMWKSMQGGNLTGFVHDLMYSEVAGKVYILPRCKGDDVKIKDVVATLNIPNDFAVDDGVGLAIIQEVLGILYMQRKPDMVHNQNPNDTQGR